CTHNSSATSCSVSKLHERHDTDRRFAERRLSSRQDVSDILRLWNAWAVGGATGTGISSPYVQVGSRGRLTPAHRRKAPRGDEAPWGRPSPGEEGGAMGTSAGRPMIGERINLCSS